MIKNVLNKLTSSFPAVHICAAFLFIVIVDFTIEDFSSLLFFGIFSCFSYLLLTKVWGASFRTLFFWLVLLVPPSITLYLTTEIMVVDELHMLSSLTKTQSMQSTGYGALWTTHLFHSPLRLILNIIPTEKMIRSQMHKSLQWLLITSAIALVCWLWYRLQSHIFSITRKQAIVPMVLTWYTLTLLPVMIHSIKLIGYNAFSLLFGLASLMVCVLTFCEKEPRKWGLAAVGLAFLAAQEKNIGGLILMFASACFFFALLRDTAFAPEVSKARRSIKALGLCFGLPLLLTGVKFIGTAIYPRMWAPRPFLGAFDGMTSWTWVGYSLFNFQTGSEFHAWISSVMPFSILAFYSVVVIMIGFGACIPRFITKLTKPILLFAAIGFPLGCVIFTYLAPSLFIAVAPVYPIASEMYQPGDKFNNYTFHYGAETSQKHRMSAIAVQFATYFSSLPLALVFGVAIAALVLFFHLCKQQQSGRLSWPQERMIFFVAVTFAVALLYPLAFGIVLIPPSSVYLNFSLAAAALLSVIPAYAWPERTLRKYNASRVYTFVIVAVLLVDILRFAPFFFNYRSPLIDIDRYPFTEDAVYGRWAPWWMGGEGVVAASRFLRDEFRHKPVTLFGQMDSGWLHKQTNVFMYSRHSWDMHTGPKDGEYDFFLFERLPVSLGFTPHYPQKTKPYKVFRAAGFSYAWIYRGSDLAKNGELPDKHDDTVVIKAF